MHITIRNPHVPSYLHGPHLVDSVGLPRFWPSVWAMLRTTGLSESTRSKKLRYIEELYRFSEESGKSELDDAIANIDLAYIGGVLEGYVVHLSNREEPPLSTQQKWESAVDFIRDTISRLKDGLIHRYDIHRVEEKLKRLDLLYTQLRVGRPRTQNNLRALPANVVESLYELLDPVSPSNPFRHERMRWRVYIGFILLLHLGLRRGEMLLLPVDAVKSSFDNSLGRMRYWINIKYPQKDDADKRYTRPNIKNPNSFRQIPISEPIVQLIQAYIANFRGRQEHSLLLSSQMGNPLSAESLNKQFAKLSNALPPSAKKLLEERTGQMYISPHDLRHTSAVARLNLLLANGDSMDEALQKMRSFFGWSRTSTMPLLYARAVFEERLASIWTEKFDDRVAIIRSLSVKEKQ